MMVELTVIILVVAVIVLFGMVIIDHKNIKFVMSIIDGHLSYHVDNMETKEKVETALKTIIAEKIAEIEKRKGGLIQ